MKYKQIMCLLLCCFCIAPLSAHNSSSHPARENRVETAADLQLWCKSESYRHFRRKKITPYNWSVITIRKLNDFHASGNWTVRNQHFAVECKITKGRKAKYTKMKIYPSH